MRYAILGGGCSFALHLAKELLRDDKTEAVISIGRHDPGPMHPLFWGGERDNRYRYMVGDVGSAGMVGWLRSLDIGTIVSFAAEGESAASFEQSWKYFHVNCTHLSLLTEELLSEPWLKRFVYVSSGEVYGHCEGPVTEKDPMRPSTPYAASKAAFDWHLQAMHRKRGFPMNIVRPCNVYGEAQQLYRLIPKTIMFGLTGRRVPLYGDGKGQKSYMHASCLARGIKAVCDAAPLGRVYNLAPRGFVAMREVVDTIAGILGIPSVTLFEDVGMRRGHDKRYWFDSCAAWNDLGWAADPFPAHLSDMMLWHEKYLDRLKELLPAELERQPVPQPTGV